MEFAYQRSAQPTPPIDSPRRKRWPLYVGIAAAAVVLLASAGGLLWYLRHPAPTVPAAIQALAGNTTVYYPQPLPGGFSFNTSDPVAAGAIPSYSLRYGTQKLVVTSQPKPKNVLFDDFYNRILQHKADVYNRNGKAVIGAANKSTLGSLVTDDTWVLVTAPQDIDSTAMTNLVGHLVKVK